MSDVDIIPDGENWNVKEENGSVISTHDTQAKAEAAGKNVATVPRRRRGLRTS